MTRHRTRKNQLAASYRCFHCASCYGCCRNFISALPAANSFINKEIMCRNVPNTHWVVAAFFAEMLFQGVVWFGGTSFPMLSPLQLYFEGNRSVCSVSIKYLSLLPVSTRSWCCPLVSLQVEAFSSNR